MMKTDSGKERNVLANRVTWLSIFINVILVVLKILAGIFGMSSAMIADAIHSLSDFATDFVVLIGSAFAKRPQDEDHPYGHGKYETLAAVIVGLVLCGIGTGICLEAFHKFYDAIFNSVMPKQPEMIAVWAGLISIAVKEWLFRITYRVGKKTGNDALTANAYHHRSDSFSSIGTTFGVAIAVLMGGGWWTLADPLAALAVGVILIILSMNLLREALDKLLECAMSSEENKFILDLANSMPEVCTPHHLRTRRVGSVAVIEIHLRVNPQMRVAESHDIASRFEENLREKFGSDTISTVHIEPIK